jgi:diaminopimelate epimerase
MTQLAAKGRPFLKMHGAGNDFVVLDGRVHPWAIDAQAAQAIADRRYGVGCDQLIIMSPSAEADSFMTIINADGSEVNACGNATRCVAWLLMEENGSDHASIETKAGLLTATREGERQIKVDMGPARLEWQQIPLASACDTLHLPLSLGPLSDPVAVNMGNPHAVFFVENADAIDLAALGPKLERDPLFPERSNIEVVSLRGDGNLRMRVWERGAGITLACGTGTCAALVAAHRRGLTGRKAEVIADGGVITIEWLENGHVTMIGPVALTFAGSLAS